MEPSFKWTTGKREETGNQCVPFCFQTTIRMTSRYSAASVPQLWLWLYKLDALAVGPQICHTNTRPSNNTFFSFLNNTTMKQAFIFRTIRPRNNSLFLSFGRFWCKAVWKQWPCFSHETLIIKRDREDHGAVGLFVCGALHVGIRPLRSILPPLLLAYIHHTHLAASELNSTRTCHSSPAPAANHSWSTSRNRGYHIITPDLFPIMIYLTQMASQKCRRKTLSLRIVKLFLTYYSCSA